MPSDSATRERAGRVGEADTKREGGEPVGSPAPITLIHRYEDFVMESPEMVTQIESIFKGLSFCIPDWVPYPDEVSEGMYAMAKLLTFCNDWVIRRRFQEADSEPQDCAGGKRSRGEWMSSQDLYGSLLSLLTLLEHSSVVIELVGHSFFNSRWLFVLAFESIRAAARSMLLARFGVTLLNVAPITDLDRTAVGCGKCKRVRTATCCSDASAADDAQQSNESSFLQPASAADDCPACGQPLLAQDLGDSAPLLTVGKRTGRVLRPPSKPKPLFGGLLGAGPEDQADCPECREWKTRHRQLLTIRRNLRLPRPARLTPDRLAAEAAYIARPLLFLAARSRWGSQSWWPWLLAFLSESASLAVLRRDGLTGYTEAEAAEVQRRSNMLLAYAVRSPVFERFSEPVLAGLIGSLKSSTGFTSAIDAMEKYARFCQQTYGYVWAS